MPRFVVESEFLSPAPVNDSIVPRPRSSLPSKGFTASLSCLSPDGRTMYSLILGNEIFIEAHNLPLEGYTQDEIEREFPAVIRTKLPQSVAATLKVDAPMELFCAEGDSMPTPPRDTDRTGPQRCLLPLLCLYTRHSVFHLQLAFSCPFVDKTVIGEVVSVTEPLESHLVSESSSTLIVRVRPAPQRRMGYATMCPPGSVAMLTHNVNVNEYALVLYHGPHAGRPNGWVSVPLRFGLEQLADDEENNITDFSFAQSNGQSLLASMSIHLLKASGDVLGASPILFDGSVVSREIVEESNDYLKYTFENDASKARVRQCFAALRFFQDAFGSDNDSGSPFITARTSIGGAAQSSTFWPVQVQGPILVSSPVEPDEEWNRALVVEPFFARDLVGMAIGRERFAVDFAVVPATSLLPRFTYMEEWEHDEVDNILANLGVLVERVSVDSDEAETAQCPVLTTLVRDPIVDTMIHYASARGVVSITTNSMRICSSEIRGEALSVEVQSTAWSSLDVSAGNGRISLAGAVVSGDALLGHTLVVSLSDGSPAAINLTESRYMHDAASIIRVEENTERLSDRVATEALKAMEATPPLYELLAPLFEQVKTGLSGMGKIVGGKTEQKDINPATLATVIAVKERCEKEIVLPLQEMDQVAGARLKELKEMYKSQLQQMAALKDTIQLLKDRIKSTSEDMEVAESNVALLAQRSGALLQATQDLRPTVTAAESEYFELLHRVKAKCDKWETLIGAVKNDSTELCGAIDAGKAAAAVDLEPVEVERCREMLHGEDLSLQQSSKKLDQTKRIVNSIVSATGLGTGDENISPPNTSEEQ